MTNTFFCQNTYIFCRSNFFAKIFFVVVKKKIVCLNSFIFPENNFAWFFLILFFWQKKNATNSFGGSGKRKKSICATIALVKRFFVSHTRDFFYLYLYNLLPAVWENDTMQCSFDSFPRIAISILWVENVKAQNTIFPNLLFWPSKKL